MCRKVLLLLCVLVCVSAAQAQEYRITEAELLQLENISENWDRNKQSLQSQVRNLKTELNEAHSSSESLNAQLRTERITSQNLSASLTAYEKEAARVQTELNNEKLKRQKNINQRNVCLAAAILQALVIIGFIALKIIIWLKRLV